MFMRDRLLFLLFLVIPTFGQNIDVDSFVESSGDTSIEVTSTRAFQLFDYSIVDVTANNPNDYVAVSNGVLFFTWFTPRRYIDISIVDNNNFEPNKTFNIIFYNFRFDIGIDSVVHTITIIEDDPPKIVSDTINVLEGSTILYTPTIN